MPVKIKTWGNIVEGPAGLRMPEETARAIEAVSKGISKDFVYQRRAKAAAKFELVPGERADVSYITTDAPDRDDEVMITKGGDWTQYNKVVTWCHTYGPVEGYNGLPVGACQWMKAGKTDTGSNGIIAKTLYYDRPADYQGEWLPDAIVHMQKQDPPALTGKSIGFIPLHAREATKSELKERPEWSGKALIDKWMGFEYCVAPVPCNPEAEAIVLAKGKIDPATKAMIRKTMEELSEGGFKGIAEIADEAFSEAASCVADMIPYYTAEEFRYTLMSKLRAGFGEAEKAEIQSAIVDVFDRAAGRV
jgi:hypothetical protein